PGPVTVQLDIDNSRFSTDQLTVRRGTEVRFVVVNHDVINHELIVGDEELHRRHENGTEPYHPPRPGEVSVGPSQTVETTYAFDETGTFEFACHLPGHLAYGMRGEVVVTPLSPHHPPP
ncbi:MAG: plastocyanin/azurin family copper-binding protein, partial [Acidimicrobiales bacterium]